MRNTLVSVFVGFSALITTAVSLAHHSEVMFSDDEITLSGVVKEFQYTNPHSWILADVTNEDGTVTTWGFEAGGPTTMMRNGIRRRDFAPGTKLTVTGRPMADGRPALVWSKAVREDGKEFYARGLPTP